MRLLLFILTLFANYVLLGQSFLEDFEKGHLNDWEVLSGIADLATDPIVEGSQSLRLWDRETVAFPESIIMHKSFNEDFGIYSYYARADGETSDADFYFHFIDFDNYYHISHRALGTYNPEFLIFKVVDGVYTELYRQNGIEDRGVWIYIRIERYCTGRMIVEFNNDAVLDIIESDIMIPGGIGFRSYGQFSYFDRIDFDPSYARPQVIDANICIGQSFAVGNNTYDTTGTYLDTLHSSTGCDSIIQLELEVLARLETQVDTIICNGDMILFGDEILSHEGGYSMGFVTEQGCDSLVNWNVSISPEFDLGPDRSICDIDGLEISAGNQNNYLWSDGSVESSLFIEQEGLYSVAIIDVNDCKQEDSIKIIQRCELRIYVPNSFSPNGDAIHDEWQPDFEILPKNYAVAVYNRWGKIEFESDDPFESWDGTVQNNSAVIGVYVWYIVADSQTFTGNLTIIR
jgi:gliding motility-associated-like protein